MIDVNLKVKIIAHPSLGFFVFLVFFGQTPAWLVGALFPNLGVNPCPLHRKCRIIATGPPEKL